MFSKKKMELHLFNMIIYWQPYYKLYAYILNYYFLFYMKILESTKIGVSYEFLKYSGIKIV